MITIRFVTLLFVCLASGIAFAQSEDAKLAEFFRAELDAGFRLRPVDATSYGEHRYDHLLGDVSAPARARWTDDTRAALAALPQRVDRSRLTRAGQIDYDIFKHRNFAGILFYNCDITGETYTKLTKQKFLAMISAALRESSTSRHVLSIRCHRR